MLSIKSWVVIKIYSNKTLRFDLNLKLLFSKINSILKPSWKFNCTIKMLIIDNWQKDHQNTVAIIKSWILTKESHHQLLVVFVFFSYFVAIEHWCWLILQASTVYYLWIFIFAYFLKWDKFLLNILSSYREKYRNIESTSKGV
jgi:hypothetical protein